MTTTRVLATAADLAHAAARLALDRVAAAIRSRGRAVVALAGGSTPRPCYRELASLALAEGLDVGAVAWLLGDERWVPVENPDSNEGMARRELLGRLQVPERAIHSWHAGHGAPVERARAYAELVVGALGPPDLVLLGVGTDGHTASLIPGSTLHLPDGRVMPLGPDIPGAAAAVLLGDGATWRLTLCPRYLTTSSSVVFLAAGESKRAALARAIAGDAATPAAWIRGAETLYLADRSAMTDPGGGGRGDFQHA